jgi:hypothetical protein
VTSRYKGSQVCHLWNLFLWLVILDNYYRRNLMSVKIIYKLSIPVLAIINLSTPIASSAETAPLYIPNSSVTSRPIFRPPQDRTSAESWLRNWHNAALNATAVDHTPPSAGEHLGPHRSSRALAIVQIAVFEAVNAASGGHYTSYTGLPKSAGASMKAAISQAAHDALVVLYPSQSATFAAQLADDKVALGNSPSVAAGLLLGEEAAESIINKRVNDGSDLVEEFWESTTNPIFYPLSTAAGYWKPDPITYDLIKVALGSKWSTVKPFILATSYQYRTAPPPALNSPRYTAAYKEVKNFGGDGIITKTKRTKEQTEIGIYWAYDGTPKLGAPPRLYNQILAKIAKDRKTDVVSTARLLALANMAMADEGIAAWESKYYYQFCRPITGIRDGDADGNAQTVGDIKYTPLGAPASNTPGPNFTPPFPAYPSGHAGFGASLFQTLRNFYGTDDIPFTFVSDEYNGVTKDNKGKVRPLKLRSFSKLSQAEEENGQSRIYLGIHWSFDKTEGIKQGRKVANLMFQKAFIKLSN